MRTLVKALLLTNAIFLSAQSAQGDEYSDCMSKCGQDYSDCMSEPQASEPDQQTAKEAACTEKASACYAQCEELKPANKDAAPEGDSTSDQGEAQGREQQLL